MKIRSFDFAIDPERLTAEEYVQFLGPAPWSQAQCKNIRGLSAMLLRDYTIGVIGGGVVGSATAKSYSEHVAAVRIFDIDPKKGNDTLESVLDCDIVFVCLPTPSRADGSCNTVALDQFFCSALVQNCGATFVIRSTVPIGYTHELQHNLGNSVKIAHSPEFLTARCAALDAQLPTRNIVGLTGTGYNHPELRDLYAQRWPHVPVMTMSSYESEAVKLFTNSFFAVKIAFWNEMRRYVDDVNDEGKLHWATIMDALLLDGRIHPSHTNVPGPDGKFGFGGACLPKDLSNMIDCLRRRGVGDFVTTAARDRNVRDRSL